MDDNGLIKEEGRKDQHHVEEEAWVDSWHGITCMVTRKVNWQRMKLGPGAGFIWIGTRHNVPSCKKGLDGQDDLIEQRVPLVGAYNPTPQVPQK